MGVNLTRRTTLTIVDAQTVTDHPELYHYTTEDGLKGIFRSNTIWATHFSDLNDSTEVKLLQDPLTSALSNRFRKLVRQHQSKSLRSRRAVRQNGGVKKISAELAHALVGGIYGVAFLGAGPMDSGTPFIASFCSHTGDQKYVREHGLLSQWRGYGRDGGYCVVFDTAMLAKLLVKEFESNFYVYLNICAARYAFDASVEQLFPELLERCNFFVSELLKGNRSPAPEDGFVPLVKGATGFKHQGFSEEQEVRIVAMPGTQAMREQFLSEHKDFVPRPIKRMYAADSDRRKRRYISLFETIDVKLPIKRVIVGPSRYQDANVARARELLGNDIEVSASATPFIG